MFKNLKIGARLGLGLGFVLLLLILLSAIAISRIGSMDAATNLITGDRMPKIAMTNELVENTLIIARAVRNIVLTNSAQWNVELATSYQTNLLALNAAIEAARAGDSGYLNLRSEVLPYIKLREQFEVEGRAPARQNVVVVQYAGHRAGLVVDELQGELQTVIKPLGKIFCGVRGIGGFTILGSGEVSLILDVQRLVEHAGSQERHMATGL